MINAESRPGNDNPFQKAVKAAAQIPGSTIWRDDAGWYHVATDAEAQEFDFDAIEVEDWREYLNC